MPEDKPIERGPIYGVELLDSLPLDGGAMRQQLLSRSDLEGIRNYRQGTRVVAGYEVLLEHYRRATAFQPAMNTATAAHRCIPSHNRRDEDCDGNINMALRHKDLHELPSHTVTMSPSYYTRTGAHTREEIRAQWEPSRRCATVEGSRVGTSTRISFREASRAERIAEGGVSRVAGEGWHRPFLRRPNLRQGHGHFYERVRG